MTDYLLSIGRGVLATALAMLPRHYWSRFEPALPVGSAALVAGLITLLAGATLGITGFFTHLHETASANNELFLQAAVKAQEDTMPMPSALNVLALFTFLFLTPQGWASSYLVASGAIRVGGAMFDDAHGDLLLTLADAGVRKWRGARAGGIEVSYRYRLEGPHVRDRIFEGAAIGLPQAHLVIVASRIKPGWEPGAVVLSDRGEFRIIQVEDRTIDGRLRRLYGLARHTDVEVFRRTVTYDFADARS